MILDLSVDLSELNRLTDAVDEFCDKRDVPPQFAMQLNLVLEELFTNTVSYGYDGQDRAGQPIRVSLSAANGAVHAEISDGGLPFDPLQLPPPDLTSDVDERAIGGLGVHFLRTLMADLAYVRRDDRNHLTFTKYLGAS